MSPRLTLDELRDVGLQKNPTNELTTNGVVCGTE